MFDQMATSEHTRQLRTRARRSERLLRRVNILKAAGQFALAMAYFGMALIGYGILNKVIRIDERQQAAEDLRAIRSRQIQRLITMDSLQAKKLDRVDSLLSRTFKP